MEATPRRFGRMVEKLGKPDDFGDEGVAATGFAEVSNNRNFLEIVFFRAFGVQLDYPIFTPQFGPDHIHFRFDVTFF